MDGHVYNDLLEPRVLLVHVPTHDVSTLIDTTSGTAIQNFQFVEHPCVAPSPETVYPKPDHTSIGSAHMSVIFRIRLGLPAYRTAHH